MEPLLRLLKRYDYLIVFVLLLIISIVMMVQHSYYQSSKITTAANRIAGGWYSGVSSLTNYFGLKEENARLATENAMLHAQVENAYLCYTDSVFTISDTVYKQRYAYTEAQVIKNSWNQQNNYIMIGKGSAHGIKPDMAVISPQGIVGVVVHTSRNFATIMPVLHSNSRNSVKVLRTGTNGTLIWNGHDFRYGSVIDVPTTHKLYAGDTIVTSGLANDFPEGIPVGYIDHLDTVRGSGFYNITIHLATDFNKLNHVYVIKNRFRAEQDNLMKQTIAFDEKK
ncbi:MAG: rod shape-determining protein MreC [Bacteroidales bacterium]|nr:rod shape-determining protein MreC [Bacteroidales bacterium]